MSVPQYTLRKALVSPKDNMEMENACGVVYEIPCHNYELKNINETGRKFSMRLREKCQKIYHKHTPGQFESHLNHVVTKVQ